MSDVFEGRGDRLKNARYSFVPGLAADDLRLQGLHFRILLHIGRFNANRGWCRLSQKDLAAAWGVTRQYVNKCVGELVEWEFLEKLGQDETGESFCQYRVRIDAGVSATGDTPPKKKRKGECRVKPTRVSPHRTPNNESVEQEDKSSAEPSAEGGGDGNATQDEVLSDRRNPFEGSSQIIPFEHVVDPLGQAASETPAGKRLPFSAETLRKVKGLFPPGGLEPLLERYAQKTAGKKIRDPNGYLYRMAVDAVSKRDGVSADLVERMASEDTAERAAALAEAVEAPPAERTWRAAAYRRSQLPEPNRAALAASIRRTA